MFADQPGNARSVEAAKTGVAVFDADVAALRAGIERVLSDGAFRAGAERIAAEMAALPGNEAAVLAMRAAGAPHPEGRRTG